MRGDGSARGLTAPLRIAQDRANRDDIATIASQARQSAGEENMPGSRNGIAALVAAMLFAGAASAPAHADELAHGRQLAEDMCGTCHAIGPEDETENVEAPTFSEIAGRYSVWDLQEALAEGIVVGHEDMPEFTLTPQQINALLTYMDTLTPDDAQQ
jgi:mono/diheme cytochrome c family protein